jgi:hypothetical protein
MFLIARSVVLGSNRFSTNCSWVRKHAFQAQQFAAESVYCFALLRGQLDYISVRLFVEGNS